ncbi:hypothetical protein FF1_038865 [Malus domestica]
MASSNTIEFEMEEIKDSQDNEEAETSASSSWKLIRLLVAEGLVQEKAGQIMEELAEENINELINQGLLQVYDDHPYTGTKLQTLPEGLQFLTTLEQLDLLPLMNDHAERLTPDGGEENYKIRHIPHIIYYHINGATNCCH